MFSFIFIRFSWFFAPCNFSALALAIPFSGETAEGSCVGLPGPGEPRGTGESVPKACPPGWMEEAQGPQKAPGAG